MVFVQIEISSICLSEPFVYHEITFACYILWGKINKLFK